MWEENCCFMTASASKINIFHEVFLTSKKGVEICRFLYKEHIFLNFQKKINFIQPLPFRLAYFFVAQIVELRSVKVFFFCMISSEINKTYSALIYA